MACRKVILRYHSQDISLQSSSTVGRAPHHNHNVEPIHPSSTFLESRRNPWSQDDILSSLNPGSAPSSPLRPYTSPQDLDSPSAHRLLGRSTPACRRNLCRICRKLHGNQGVTRTGEINEFGQFEQSRHWATFGNAPMI